MYFLSIVIFLMSFLTFLPLPAEFVAEPKQAAVGHVNIKMVLPAGESIVVTIKPKSGPLITAQVKSENGTLIWRSPPIPAGPYSITFALPQQYQPLPLEKRFLRPDEETHLIFHLAHVSKTTSVRVIANVPEAIYLLKSNKNTQVLKGEGREFSFSDLKAGTYVLSLATTEPDYFIPPEDVRFYLNEDENKILKVNYQIAGKLNIKTNVTQSAVTIQEIGGQQKVYKDQINDHTGSYTLPEGKYKIVLSSPGGEEISAHNQIAPAPIEVDVRALNSTEYYLAYHANDSFGGVAERKLTITTNIGMGGFTIRKFVNDIEEVIGHFYGKYVQLTPPAGDRYVVTFDDVPNYQTPAEVILTMQSGEEKTIQAAYQPILQSLLVPAGKSLVGDALSEEDINERPAKIVSISAFFVGTYEITNAQYAVWLNQAVKAGTVVYVKEADNRGEVLDLQGRLLCKTFAADPYSQISVQILGLGIPVFGPIPGKDLYPVINVSWYGATAYCKDNNCRLLTEAEWEKAAAVPSEKEGTPLRKYIYGFSSNEIDPSWANYKDNDRNLQYFRVLTTPVGFYNGINQLPLNAKNLTQERTHRAVSPCGAFDMSGNVWEWVSDWFSDKYYQELTSNDPQGPPSGTKKVVKGGCYDSLFSGVRVSERLGLPPDHCDAYTGFRVAINALEAEKKSR